MLNKITGYFKDTQTELKHVIWPSRNQVVFYTLIVIVSSVLVAYYLGFFDGIFSVLVESIIKHENFFSLLFSSFQF